MAKPFLAPITLAGTESLPDARLVELIEAIIHGVVDVSTTDTPATFARSTSPAATADVQYWWVMGYQPWGVDHYLKGGKMKVERTAAGLVVQQVESWYTHNGLVVDSNIGLLDFDLVMQTQGNEYTHNAEAASHIPVQSITYEIKTGEWAFGEEVKEGDEPALTGTEHVTDARHIRLHTAYLSGDQVGSGDGAPIAARAVRVLDDPAPTAAAQWWWVAVQRQHRRHRGRQDPRELQQRRRRRDPREQRVPQRADGRGARRRRSRGAAGHADRSGDSAGWIATDPTNAGYGVHSLLYSVDSHARRWPTTSVTRTASRSPSAARWWGPCAAAPPSLATAAGTRTCSSARTTPAPTWCSTGRPATRARA